MQEKSLVELLSPIGLHHCRKSFGSDDNIVKAICKSKIPKKADEAEKSVDFLGLHLTWHWALPEVKPWAGQATMNTVLHQRIEAVKDATYKNESLLDWLLPLKTELGLDSRINTNALDAGFSPQEIGMPIMCYVVAELLTIVGLELIPITRHGRKTYSIDHDGDRWIWTYQARGTGHHRRATAARVQAPIAQSDTATRDAATIKAEWDDGLQQYIDRERGWYSTDGDTWEDESGLPIDAEEFPYFAISLVGGPRNGAVVG